MRQITVLDNGWQFSRDFKNWEQVSVPHDWAVWGDFEKDNDCQDTAITADGEKENNKHYGRTGGLPHAGVGCYRKEFVLSQDDSDKNIRLEFDGIMSHSEVYVNGRKAGGRPYGYSSFAVDITGFVTFGQANLIEVKVDNPPSASRWYPGAGIYRQARLVINEQDHFLYQGIRLTTENLDIEKRMATLCVEAETSCENPEIQTVVTVDGKCFKSSTARVVIEGFKLWSVDMPNLYQVDVQLVKNGMTTDCCSIQYGFRQIEFDPDAGMSVNGEKTKLNGVCLHHDLGPLGAAFNKASMLHRLKLLKEIGCNAIRTSHNPPDPVLLDLCDELGFYVIDEAFDAWEHGKVENDYSRDYSEWHETDLEDFVKRDRNHPCIVMWSIGNEINEQKIENGSAYVNALQNIVRRLDSRPVTAGFDIPDKAIENGLAAAIEILGWNYKPARYPEFRQKFPDKVQYGSETSSTVSTRGYYHFPVVTGPAEHESQQCSSYDVEFPPWASTAETEFAAQEACPWMIGEFVWTGFDYLGEPTPYKFEWPSHSSYFGIFDLAGIPKDRAWLYKARWSNQPVLHILPHWTWPQREGLVTPVHIYTNYPFVELIANGKSYGTKSPECCRVRFDDVVYHAGAVVALAKNANGEVVEKATVRTSSIPHAICLSADRSEVSADRDDMIFVTASVVDEEGNLCPHYNEEITFTVSGGGCFEAAANGDPCSLDRFRCNTLHIFNGQCLAVIRSNESLEKIMVKAESWNLAAAEIEIKKQPRLK